MLVHNGPAGVPALPARPCAKRRRSHDETPGPGAEDHLARADIWGRTFPLAAGHAVRTGPRVGPRPGLVEHRTRARGNGGPPRAGEADRGPQPRAAAAL